MFGYITPLEGELKVKEQQFYKSLYCGLCKTMGKRVCPESRMTLSYDIVFLALVRFLLSEEKVEFKKCRCSVSPFKKKTVVLSNPSLNYCSAVGALLAYHNIADDVSDKKGVKRLGAKALLSFSKRMRKRAAIPELDSYISKKLKELSDIEKSGQKSLDMCADSFGELLKYVFSYGYGGDASKKLIAEEIGYNIGKWIYILDAADDYEKDKKSGEFNPIEDFDAQKLEITLTMCLTGVERAVCLIDAYDSGIMSIVQNIIYLGMPFKAKKVLEKEVQS